jgi:hypothetical protein
MDRCKVSALLRIEQLARDASVRQFCELYSGPVSIHTRLLEVQLKALNPICLDAP